MFSIISHNPYFNRWFSAIGFSKKLIKQIKKVTILILIDGFLQFNGLFKMVSICISHNPYFNRWFSAIKYDAIRKNNSKSSQSLF